MVETIAAIATPPGLGAIAVVRCSGPDAHAIVQRHLDRRIDRFRTLIRCNFTNEIGEPIDEVLVAFFKGPRSYTGEDMAEIYCHGGALVSSMILDALVRSGARLAKNGEFTKRAVLNGKMDLVKAEAVLQLIEAKSEEALRLALKNLKGSLSKELNTFRERLLLVLSKIEVSVDYGEDVVIEEREIVDDLRVLADELQGKLTHAAQGITLSNGIRVAIIGRPNVGKSTLLNKLLREDRAIVTHVPGTTRDVVRGEIRIGGMLFSLSDTAGLRQTDDLIERLGIEKTMEEVGRADFIIHLLDATTGLTDDDLYISKLIDPSKTLRVWNKCDLVGRKPSNNGEIAISALTGEGLVELERRLRELATSIVRGGELSNVTTSRQLEHLRRTYEHVRRALTNIECGAPIDLASIEIRYALSELDTLLGRSFTDDLLDTIFSNFCVGK